jgi:putative peptidoglycan lipid II flippase
MWGAVINLTVNVVFDYILLKYMGVPGIALSTAIVYLTSASFVIFCCFRLLKKKSAGPANA